MQFTATWMDIEIIVLSDYCTKWSKSEIESQTPHAIIYMWNPKYDTNENKKRKQKETHRERTDL